MEKEIETSMCDFDRDSIHLEFLILPSLIEEPLIVDQSVHTKIR